MALCIRQSTKGLLRLNYNGFRMYSTDVTCTGSDNKNQKNFSKECQKFRFEQHQILTQSQIQNASSKTSAQNLLCGENQIPINGQNDLQEIENQSFQNLEGKTDNCETPLDILLNSPPKLTAEEIHRIVHPYSSTADDIHIHCRQLLFERSLKHVQDDRVAKVNMNEKYASDDIFEYKKMPLSVLSTNYLSKSLQTPQRHTDPENVIEYLCSSSSGETSSKISKSGPSIDQLEKLKDHLAKELPNFLTKRHDYRIYTPEIIFENNFAGENKVYRGIKAYVMELNKIKVLTHFKYAHAMFHIISITPNPVDGTVRMRWRISGLPQLKAFKFWKFMPWSFRKTIKEDSEWNDGYSTFFVGKDGRVFKHRVERVMRDEEMAGDKKTGLALGLAILLGLVPRPGDFHTFLVTKKAGKIPAITNE